MVAPPPRPPLEMADILRAYGDSYRSRHPLTPEQAAVLRHLVACRTAVLGGHRDACDRCGFVRVSYNSCRDRHCPKCQALKRAQWLEQRLQRLLPVHYFHVVFTLPNALNPLILKNKALLYSLLFQAASQTLLQLAADPKRLGAQIGFTAILHTWGQNLLFHPHVHCVVTGGGLATDETQWIPARQRYLLPLKVIASLFRGKFLAALQAFYDAGQLTLDGSVQSLSARQAFRTFIDRLYRRDWVLYAKRPFGGAEHVYRYLGRYTHRVAISNARLIALQDGHVRFRYKDYADANRTKEMTLTTEEFIRRFLLHVLPKRFVRIRHYGLLAGRNVQTKLVRCCALLNAPPATPRQIPKTWIERLQEYTGEHPLLCPRCQAMLIRHPFERFPSSQALVAQSFTESLAVFHTVPVLDSS